MGDCHYFSIRSLFWCLDAVTFGPQAESFRANDAPESETLDSSREVQALAAIALMLLATIGMITPNPTGITSHRFF